MILELTLYVNGLPNEAIPVFISSKHIISIDRLHRMEGENEIQYAEINLEHGISYKVKETAEWITAVLNSIV
jgi:hypothetical protein